MALYDRLPNQFKDIARTLYSFIPIERRLGKKYWELRRFLDCAQWWNLRKIEDWQLTKIKEIVNYAYCCVPGYYELYHSAGVTPADIQKLEDVQYLPFTTKQLLRDHIKDFTTQKIPVRDMRYVTTGGSTGIPFGFYHTRQNRWVENAFIHAGWLRSGWQLKRPSIVLRGDFIGTEKEFYFASPQRNEYNLSIYYLTNRSYKKYLNFLLKKRPFAIQAYPSAITILADLMCEYGDEGKIDVKVLLLASENLYGWQKQKILKAFPQARLFSHYGHAEQAVLAPWCESEDTFHVWPFYGYTELINETGGIVECGKVGEIVGTSFWNLGTPFIRYRTMDLAENLGMGCPACLRDFLILKRIEGRLQEFVVTSTGRYISMTAINLHSDAFDEVSQFQFFQDTIGKISLKIVPKAQYSAESAQKIYRAIKPKLGEDLDLSIELVAEIPRTMSGKHRFLDQRLNIRYGDQ